MIQSTKCVNGRRGLFVSLKADFRVKRALSLHLVAALTRCVASKSIDNRDYDDDERSVTMLC